MAGETVIFYGDTRLRRVVTHSVESAPVYDPSGTDLMYWRHVVRASGVVTVFGNCEWSSQPYPSSGSAAGSAGSVIAYRASLPPRQSFEMRVGNTNEAFPFNGNVLLWATPFGRTAPENLTGFDVNNGPRCNKFEITHVGAGDVYHVNAEFEVCIVECNSDGSCPDNTKRVLSHRWGCVDSIDGNRRLIRTYTGMLRLATGRDNPNMFRGMIVPPLQPRMKRETIQFHVSEDGLNCQYTIMDSQQAQAAPAPCSDWELNVTNSGALNMIHHREVAGLLVAPDTENAATLVQIAWYIIMAKLYNATEAEIVAAKKKDTILLESVNFTEHIGRQTSLSFSARAQIVPAQEVDDAGADGADAEARNAGATSAYVNRLIGLIGVPLRTELLQPGAQFYHPYRNDGGRDPYGTGAIESPYLEGPARLVTMLLAYLQTPCDDNHSIREAGLTTFPENTNETPDSVPQDSYSLNAYLHKSLPREDSTYFTPAAKANVYTSWRMENTIRQNSGYAAMPIAGGDSESDDSYDSDSPKEATRFVVLCRPQARRVVRIHAERVGEWPEFPAMASLPGFESASPGGGNLPVQKLLTSNELYSRTAVTVTGQPVFKKCVEAIFGLSRMPQPSEKLPLGREIWNSTVNSQATSQVATDGAW